MRRDLAAAQLEQSLVIVHSIQPAVEQENWDAARTSLERIAARLPGTRLVLADVAGIEVSSAPQKKTVLTQGDLQALLSGLRLTHWMPLDNTLRALVPVMGSRRETLAILVYDSDQSAKLSRMQAEKVQHTIIYLLIPLIMLCLFLLASWQLFVYPLKEIYRLSRAITLGAPARAPDAPIIEIQQINQAFNEIIDTLSKRQARLEDAVMERTRALDESHAEIRSHNRLMNELIARSELLSRSITMDEVVGVIGEGALTLSKADRMAIFLLNKRGPECCWSYNLSEAVIKAVVSILEQGQYFTGSFTSRPILVKDIEIEICEPRLREIFKLGSFRGVSAWPLIYQEKAIAVVCCFYNQPAVHKHPGIEALEAFFRQASVSIENARLYESECAQRILAEALCDIAATLNSTLDLNEVLERIIHNLGRVVPHDASGIMLIEGETLYPVRWTGIPAESAEAFESWRYTYHDLYNRRVMIDTAQSLVVPNTSQESRWVRTKGLEWVRSYAGAPICQRGEVTGFIDLMSGKPNFFDPDVGPILQAFAVQAAVAMDNARLYEQSQQRMAETSALFRAVQPLFHPTNDIFAFSQQIAHSVTQEFASSHCSILLLNETRTHLTLAGQSGSLKLTTSDLDLNGPGLTVAAVRTGRTIYSPDVTTEKNYVAGAEQSRCELVIPLFASGAVIGVLNLESIQVDAFDERARRLLATFAERAALGLENARLFGTIRMNAEEMTRLSKIAERRAQEAETLRLAAASVNSTLDLQTVLDRILKHLDHVIPHESACIFLFEDENMMRAWAVKSVARSEEVLHQTFPRNDALLQQIEQTNRPMVLRDAQNDPRFKGWGGTSGVRSWMGIPLLAVNELIGTLTLDRYSSDEFLPEEIELAQAFANQAAVAVQNARLYDTAQQHSRELEALHSATSTLVSTLDLQKLLERILAAAARAVPMTEAALLHLVGEGNKLYLRVRQGVSAINEQCYNWNDDKSPWRWALEHGKPLLACSGSLPPGEECLFSCPPDWNDQSMMIVPLILDHQPMGLITLISSQGGQFTEQELTLLNSFANTATAAMHNAQLHSAVQHLAITDPLTGVFNRRGFYDYAGRVIEQAQILGRPIAAIMIDIDFFKRVNDNYGHDAGDIVLRELVDRCRTVLRDADLICRYGGEEFAILLTESDISGAMNAANRILYAITSDPMNTPAGPVSITVSVGIAEYNNTGDTLDRLLKCADLALFTAKKQGRNRVCVWEE